MKIGKMVKDRNIVENLARDDIVDATEVQEKAIPVIMEGKDAVVQSETGSGKTLAFVLPIAEKLRGEGIKALVIAPTRELAKQITSVFKKYTHLKSVSIYGGVSISRQIEELQHANVAVGTPGRLLDLIERGELRLSGIQFLVLDEADRMLDMGFIEDIEKIIEATNEHRQTLLFSATIPDEVIRISRKYMKNPIKILIERKTTTVKQKHLFYVVSVNEKFSLLVHLLKNSNGSHSLIFCATKKMADSVAAQLKMYGIKAEAIHGDLTQKQREQVLHKFRKKMVRALVATDVAARGLDIDGITHVYNFDVPNEIEMYTHRAGRTARMGNEGMVISIVSDKDYVLFGRIHRAKGNLEEVEKPQFQKIPFKIDRYNKKRQRKGYYRRRY